MTMHERNSQGRYLAGGQDPSLARSPSGLSRNDILVMTLRQRSRLDVEDEKWFQDDIASTDTVIAVGVIDG